MTDCLLLDRLGTVLARASNLSLARSLAHSEYPSVYVWIVREADHVLLAHRHLAPRHVPAPHWPTSPLAPPARGCPLWAALRHPRTVDELAAVLPAWDREAIKRRLLALWDDGEVRVVRGVWRRRYPLSAAGRVAS